MYKQQKNTRFPRISREINFVDSADSKIQKKVLILFILLICLILLIFDTKNSQKHTLRFLQFPQEQLLQLLSLPGSVCFTCYHHDTVPETNITPENRLGPKRKFHLPTIPFSGPNLLLVSGRVNYLPTVNQILGRPQLIHIS